MLINMKYRIQIILLISVLSGFVWMACDKIDQPLVIVDQQNIPVNISDTVYFVDSVVVTEKQVLLEDFTGHLCVNCPEAAIMAHELAASLDHKLIIYSVHAGYYATPDPNPASLYTDDLTSETGEALYADFQVFVNPNALIDRVKHGGAVQVNPDNWQTAVNSELGKPNTANISLINAYYPNLNTVRIQVKSKFTTPLEGKFRLCVYIAEDSIVSPQKNNNPAVGPSPDWEDYIHRNVLRGAINTTYGEYFSADGTIAANEIYPKEYFYEINPNWVANHCNIVAFLLNEETKEIHQVAECEIKTE
jgi:thiol-disulfide isomerase/thioredoxin